MSIDANLDQDLVVLSCRSNSELGNHIQTLFEERGYKVKRLSGGSDDPIVQHHGNYVAGYKQILFMYFPRLPGDASRSESKAIAEK